MIINLNLHKIKTFYKYILIIFYYYFNEFTPHLNLSIIFK